MGKDYTWVKSEKVKFRKVNSGIVDSVSTWFKLVAVLKHASVD